MRSAFAALLAALLVLAACGDDDDAPPDSSPTLVSTPSATPSPTSPGDTPEPGTPGETDPPANTEAPTDSPEETNPPATNVNLLTPVDKQHSLPADYVPPDLSPIPSAYLAPGFGGSLRTDALGDMTAMLDAAYAENHDIRCRSAYRSYSEQESTFNYWVSVLGYEEATRVSAMPGHSEHQLGSVCDLTSPEVGWDLLESFGTTAAGQWLVARAHEYGFVLSYPEGQESVTGYSYEPWHWRYLGPAEAQAFEASGLTLNQYLLQ
ncbi:MAG TPA: D-alanyl-D-alanine carboxypeptidase family protein [Dehalococcoidia bacterium]|nr:D-alanyl-D-alanine carboxypeptidase family protein [Dehalococcoidia bacterium]